MPAALTCPVCGAPLSEAPRPDVPVRCPFCNILVEHRDAPAPPPPAPAPPTLTPERLRTELGAARARGGARSSSWITLVALTALIGGIVAAVAALVHGIASSKGVGGIPLEHVSSLASLDGTPATVAAALDLDPPEDARVYVKVRDPPVDYVIFGWNEALPAHATSFGFFLREGDPAAPPAVDRLAATLGRRLVREDDGRLTFYAGGAHLWVSNPLSSIAVDARPQDDDRGAARLDLLWRVTTGAIAGRDVPVTDEERRVLLGEGWPLATLASLDPRIGLDAALAEIPRRFPGSVRDLVGGLEWSIAVDHPWFDDAELRWPNRAGARLEAFRLDPAPRAGHRGFPDQAAVRACLEAIHGPGQVREQDHLAGTWSASWRIQGLGDVHLGSSSLALNFGRWSDTEAGPDPEAWRRLLVGLDPCGRSPAAP